MRAFHDSSAKVRAVHSTAAGVHLRTADWALQEAAAPAVRNLLLEIDDEFAESQPLLAIAVPAWMCRGEQPERRALAAAFAH